MICIAYDYSNRVISIVNAVSLEIAHAYWQGAGIIPHSSKAESDFTPIGETPNGVYPLLKTETRSVSRLHYELDGNAEVVIVKDR